MSIDRSKPSVVSVSFFAVRFNNSFGIGREAEIAVKNPDCPLIAHCDYQAAYEPTILGTPFECKRSI
jgi:hypothetical protein